MILLFIGDSIVKQGERFSGFLRLLRSMKYPDIIIKSRGINGDTAAGVKLRIEQDVKYHKPDIVYLSIGINDVWKKYNGDTGLSSAKDPSHLLKKQFKHDINDIITTVETLGAQIVLCTPTIIELNTEHDKILEEYVDIIRSIAKEKQVDLIDVRQHLQNNLVFFNKDFTSDGVHLNDLGNELFAQVVNKHISSLIP